jgi:hypothetical protein
VNVRRFGFTLERSFKHLLRRNILAAIELDDATVVKRVSIAWKNALRPQARFRNREIRSRASRDFRYLRILVYENSKLVPRFSKTAPGKLLMCAFERNESCRLILRRWSWRRAESALVELLEPQLASASF